MSKAGVCVCLFTWALCGAGSVAAREEGVADEKRSSGGIADPAAVYATKLGYTYDAAEGIVVFPDGTRCGTWDFYRGKAGQKWSYCERHGGKIECRTEDRGSWIAEYAVCVFPDGSECGEADFIEGLCAPGVYKRWSLNEKERIRCAAEDE